MASVLKALCPVEALSSQWERASAPRQSFSGVGAKEGEQRTVKGVWWRKGENRKPKESAKEMWELKCWQPSWVKIRAKAGVTTCDTLRLTLPEAQRERFKLNVSSWLSL